ncbi:reticulocalbin-2-like isoform X2 [Lineus longissimus]|uniref:reticulocalbin-2-like isoform X2 n=1 Tax=Lineus longissimus TaxID=88925 RepID=UPI002B4EE9BA
MKLLYSVVLFGLLSLAFADGIPHPKEHRKGDHVKEEAHPGVDSNLHFKDGEHDADYDHKAFLGSEDEADEFKELDPDEAKKRLLVLAKRMDTDKSGDVSKDELQHWISNSFKSLDEADAKKQFDRQDKDKNGSVTWSEMLQEVYGYTPEEVAQHENDSSDEMKNFVQMTKDDRKKFDLADESGDGTLDFKEFVAYHNPHNFARMAPVEVEKTMRDYDKDKDGKISYTEYQQKDESEEAKEEDQAEMEKQFKSYDKNNDGHLDADEVKAWVIPAMDELSVEEAAHLFTEADKDKDGKLTMDEITDSHDLFVGSQATDYGDALQRMKEEL